MHFTIAIQIVCMLFLNVKPLDKGYEVKSNILGAISQSYAQKGLLFFLLIPLSYDTSFAIETPTAHDEPMSSPPATHQLVRQTGAVAGHIDPPPRGRD